MWSNGAASSRHRPEQLARLGTGEGDRVSAQLLDNWWALATEPAHVGRRDLGERKVVAGPGVDPVGQALQLRPPGSSSDA